MSMGDRLEMAEWINGWPSTDDAKHWDAWEAANANIIIDGGVSANTRLRRDAQALADQRGLTLHLPNMLYCLDNAAMIAGLACLRHQRGLTDDLTLSPSPTGTY